MKILMILLVVTMVYSISDAAEDKGSNATLSECIAEASSAADLIECAAKRDKDMDALGDDKVYECLIKGDDKKIYWYEDCIHG